MSKEIRELEENSKRIIENMRPQTIAQYHIKQWLDDNFIMGYSSYHLILEVPVTLSQQQIYVKVEVQIRTLAMDFWANIEHKTKYKTEGKISKKESKQLISYAKAINKIDNNMMILSSK